MPTTVEQNKRPDYDDVIVDIADYVMNYNVTSEEAWSTAKYCLMDTLGCGMLALSYPECASFWDHWYKDTGSQWRSFPGTQFPLER